MSRMSYMMRDECDSGRMASAAASYGEEHASSEREDVTISQLQWAAHYLPSTKPMNMDKQIKSDMNAMRGKAIIISPRGTYLSSRESMLSIILNMSLPTNFYIPTIPTKGAIEGSKYGLGSIISCPNHQMLKRIQSHFFANLS